jgi:hypothetical protein
MSGRNSSGRSLRGRGDRNRMRDGEGTSPQVITRIQKVVPHADLILLKLDGSNIVAWRQSLSTHLQSNFGQLGGFIENNQLYVRVIPTANMIKNIYAGHAAATLARLFEYATIENMKSVARDSDKYMEMFGLLLSCVTEEGLVDKVTSDAAYAAARLANNPLQLFNIIRRIHSLQQNNIGTVESQYLVQERYNSLYQLHNWDLAYYESEFELYVMNMATVGLPVIPNAAGAQARNFFMHLCDKRFGQYQAKVLNYERDNLGIFPATVQAVVNGCRSHIVLPTLMNNMHAGNIV